VILKRHYHEIIILSSIFIGILASLGGLNRSFDFMIKVTLFILMISIMLSISFRALQQALQEWRFIKTVLLINFLIIPGIALILVFPIENNLVRLGLLMYLFTPCTDWFLSYTKIAKGDVALGIIVTPINLFMQLLLLMLLLSYYSTFLFDPAIILKTIMLFLILPFLIASIMRWINPIRSEWLSEKLQVPVLVPLLFFIFADYGNTLLTDVNLVIPVFTTVPVFFILIFLITKLIASKNMPYEKYVLLTFTTIARNSPLAIAIAIMVFQSPIVPLIIAMAVVVEMPILSILAGYFKHILFASNKSYKW
jgi:ACR3 family arsenite efflux pump ArsB